MRLENEVLALKIENCHLRMVQLQSQHAQIAAEQQALLKDAITEAGAPEGAAYDLQTRTFSTPQTPAEVIPMNRKQRRTVASQERRK